MPSDPLAPIDAVRAEIEVATAALDKLYAKRGTAFVKLRTRNPEISYQRIAERAGVSVPAVIQGVERAHDRAHVSRKGHPEKVEGCPSCYPKPAKVSKAG